MNQPVRTLLIGVGARGKAPNAIPCGEKLLAPSGKRSVKIRCNHVTRRARDAHRRELDLFERCELSRTADLDQQFVVVDHRNRRPMPIQLFSHADLLSTPNLAGVRL